MGFVGFVLFSEIALLLPQPNPFLAVKMCRLRLSIVLMVIFCTVWNSPLSLHPYFFLLSSLFKHKLLCWPKAIVPYLGLIVWVVTP